MRDSNMVQSHMDYITVNFSKLDHVLGHEISCNKCKRIEIIQSTVAATELNWKSYTIISGKSQIFGN